MTKEEAKELKPFNVLVYKEHNGKKVDVLVKKVTDNGVFCLFKIQSTAILCKFKDLEKQY